jgi:pimeloyl-ACP methyl ester carboxylesterase
MVDTHSDDLKLQNLPAAQLGGSSGLGGVDISYLEAGPQDGRLAICLHGFPDSAWTWRHLLPVLGSAGYHAVAPFLRGYAPSGLAPDGAYQSGALSVDACVLDEALGDERPSVLIGHDWGALATYGAAGLRPDRFDKVIALAVPPVPAAASTFFSYDQIKKSFYIFVFQTPLAEMLVGADDCNFIDRLWADWSPGYDAGWDLAKVKESIGDPDRLSAAIGYYRAMLDPSNHVAGYEEAQQASQGIPPQPLLYFHGAADGCMGIRSLSEITPMLAEGSETMMVEGAGHFLHLERPTEIQENILRFLQK